MQCENVFILIGSVCAFWFSLCIMKHLLSRNMLNVVVLNFRPWKGDRLPIADKEDQKKEKQRVPFK